MSKSHSYIFESHNSNYGSGRSNRTRVNSSYYRLKLSFEFERSTTMPLHNHTTGARDARAKSAFEPV